MFENLGFFRSKFSIFTIGEYRKHGFIKVGEVKSAISTISEKSAFSTWPLKVQDDVQLAIAKFCLSIKDCRSQASFNDFTIKGLGPKILA